MSAGTEPQLDPQRARRDAGPLTNRGKARRQELLRAARQVFERQGFYETRVADIVAEAGVSQGTFYTYFESKDVVFREVANDVAEQMLHGLHADALADDPLERVRDALQRFVDVYRPAARMLAVIEQVASTTPEMRELRLALREAFVQRSARGIRRWQQDGTADDALDAELAAEVLGSMVDQVCYVWLSLGQEFQEGELIDALGLIWSRAIGVRTTSRTSRVRRALRPPARA